MRRCHRHETRTPLFAHLVRQRARQRIRRSALHRAVCKAAGAIDLCIANEGQQLLELGIGLAGEARDEGAAHDQLRAHLAPALQPLQVALATRRPLHAPQHIGVRMLERHVEVRQHQPLRHQRHDVVDVWIGVHVVQPHPRAVRRGDLAELLHEVEHASLHRLAVPEAGAVPGVDTVGARVLADDEQFLHAGFEQALRFAEHVAHRPADEVTAQARDDAERAAVVAAFADLQIRIVLRRQLDALRRQQIDERVVRLRHMQVHRVHHFLRRVRAGDRKHFRVHLPHEVLTLLAGLRTEAASDDDLAVFGERLADRVEAFLHRVVDEAAGVDDHEVGTVEGLRRDITFGAEPREDQL
jgi:hypothetical protein